MASNFAPVTEEDILAFAERLRNFTDGELWRLSVHFRPNMIYVIENEFSTVLSNLTQETVITSEKAERYADLEKRQGATKAAEKLVDDILAESREVGIEFWKTLSALRRKSSHPNLHGMIGEVQDNGKALLNEILLNESGHILDPVLKACQEEHKSLLYEQTQWLRESGGAKKPEGQRSLLNHYVELKVVSDAHFRKQRQYENEALAAAGELNEYRLRRKTQAELERITPNQLFRWCFRSKRKPLSVMVSGVAGVGKTTLVQKFVFDWATGKHYQKFSFVFCFMFRDLNTVGPRTSLESLILREYPSLRDKLETILQKLENLLFIFDGLDESNSDLNLSRNRTPNFCTQPGDVKPVNVIVASLLNQTLLKGSSVLLTSRPSKLARLETGVLHRVTSIVGFLSQEREQYFQNFFGDDAVAEKALAHVRDSQVLYTLCYSPSYCWITCTALQPSFSGKKGRPPPLPKTATQLFVRCTKHMLENHTRELPEKEEVREMLIRLGWLAEFGLKNRILVFDQDHLESFSLKGSPVLTAFLVESIHGDSTSSQVTYSFVHLTVQEFFAALVHYLVFKEENFDDAMARAGGGQSGEYEIFLRFLSGLSHPATRVPLEEVLGKFSAVTTKRVIDWLQQVDISDFLSTEAVISEKVIDWLTQIDLSDLVSMKFRTIKKIIRYHEMFTQWYSSVFLGLDSHVGKKKALNFFSLLFEAHNPPLVHQAMEDAPCLDFSELFLMPVDCTILSYILKCLKTIKVLNLNSCLIQNEGLQKLSPQLYKVRELSLCNNDLTNSAVKDLVSALKHPDCQLETLRLANNGLTEECCKDLSLALSENQSLLCLDLRKNKLHDKGLSDLLEAFRSPRCKIQRLMLQENALSDASWEKLSTALSESTSLKTLNLSGNPCTDHCSPEMANFIRTCPALTELRLSLTDIPSEVQDQLDRLASERKRLWLVLTDKFHEVEDWQKRFESKREDLRFVIFESFAKYHLGKTSRYQERSRLRVPDQLRVWV
ncbi:NACHT, LRR and PYD domains-containing protein 6-like [Tiliqua scincoides]|uniref:NACHT, LRR and PYD domains-containing protein 6-like n=1 Tax=Tiliqua scincoides TaxID=71010 RepID=UPI003463172D